MKKIGVMSKKILFIAVNLASGGAERQMVTVLNLLKERGYDVSVACFSEGDFHEKTVREHGIPITWMIEPNYVKRAMKYRRYVRSGHYDAVVSFLESAGFLNNFAAIGGKSWKVITGERSAKQRTFTSWRGKFYAWMQRCSDAIVCNSENARGMWNYYYPQYGSKLTTIYNTVMLESVTSTYCERRNGRTHIVIAATYQQLKNPVLLTKAVAQLEQSYKNRLRIDWFGKREFKGSVIDQCEEIVAKYGLEDIICFHDRTHEIHNRMKEADYVALFSTVEGLPNTICEGMTLGKPIIMTKVSDYATLVSDRNGFLCEGTLESIKAVLQVAIDCPIEKLRTMGEESKRKAGQLFSKEIITKQWIDIIEK